MQSPILAPVPRTLRRERGTYTLRAGRAMVLHGAALNGGTAGARMLQRALERHAGVAWEVRAASGLAELEGVVAVIDPKAAKQREGYHLTVGDERIAIVGHDAAGVFYGFATLTQLVRQYGARLPRLHIEDAPEFAHRGVMVDVSRDKVPTMETLYALIDMLAEWKINQFQLYMEHTFAYQQHRAVWKDASPFSGEEILALDAYCRERHMELVPNQNSFGHMSRWLTHRAYTGLAETPRGTKLPWGKLPPFTLNPGDPRSLQLLEGLYAELLPHFSSRQFNVGCDETFDLGRGRSAADAERRGVGRVYLEFLKKIHALCEKHGRRMMFWGDIITQHPELIGEVPRDAIALEWGYEHDHPYAVDARAYAKAGLTYYACPGAGGWNSFVGRTENTLANVRNATTNGRRHGAAGVLVTEWGDNGHMQPMAAAYLGLLYGAAMAWSPKANEGMDVAAALSLHAFDDPSGRTGRAVHDLGNAYTAYGGRTRNGTLFQQLYFAPMDSDWPMQRIPDRGFEAASDALTDAAARVVASRMRRDDAQLVAEEMACATELALAGAEIGAAKHARHRGVAPSKLRPAFRRAAKRIEAAVPEYERLWLARNRPGGMRDSVKRLHETVAMLRGAAG